MFVIGDFLTSFRCNLCRHLPLGQIVLAGMLANDSSALASTTPNAGSVYQMTRYRITGRRNPSGVIGDFYGSSRRATRSGGSDVLAGEAVCNLPGCVGGR